LFDSWRGDLHGKVLTDLHKTVKPLASNSLSRLVTVRFSATVRALVKIISTKFAV
jgi:hypothetical protein